MKRRIIGALRSVGLISLHTSPLVQPGSGDGGGMNVYVRELGTALAQRGITTTIFTRRTADTQPDRVQLEPNLAVVHLDAGAHGLPKEQLHRVVDEFADRLVDWMKNDLGGLDIIHANYWLSALAAERIKERCGTPFVVTFHTLAAVKNAVGEPEPGYRLEAERAMVDAADGICAASPADADDVVVLGGASRDKVSVVPPGVEHALFSPGSRAGARAALGMGADPHVLFVGRIQPLKGAADAVAAVAGMECPRTRLTMIGGPSGARGASELTRIRSLLAAGSLGDRVTLVEPQPHHVLSTYYRAADMVIVPSRTESFGLVALEAAACGIPVIASNVGGLGFVVEHDVTGILLDSHDPAVATAAIDTLLAQPERAARLGANGYLRSRFFTWSAAATQAVRHYERILADRGALGHQASAR